jgi:hypothetical protein
MKAGTKLRFLNNTLENIDFSIISTKLIHFWKRHICIPVSNKPFPKVYQLCRNDGEIKLTISRIVSSKVTLWKYGERQFTTVKFKF